MPGIVLTGADRTPLTQQPGWIPALRVYEAAAAPVTPKAAARRVATGFDVR
jgi:hypothetical protein